MINDKLKINFYVYFLLYFSLAFKNANENLYFKSKTTNQPQYLPTYYTNKLAISEKI